MLPVSYSIASAVENAVAVMATRSPSCTSVIQSFLIPLSDAASLFFIRLKFDINGNSQMQSASVITFSICRAAGRWACSQPRRSRGKGWPEMGVAAQGGWQDPILSHGRWKGSHEVLYPGVHRQ